MSESHFWLKSLKNQASNLAHKKNLAKAKALFLLVGKTRLPSAILSVGGYNKKLTRSARLGFFLVRLCVQARAAPNKRSQHYRASFLLVGKTRFELATPCTPCKCATGLRHFPNLTFSNLIEHIAFLRPSRP